MLSHFRVHFDNLRVRVAARFIQKIQNSSLVWRILDQAKIPGAGLDLLRVDFAPDLTQKPPWESSPHPHFSHLIERDSSSIRSLAQKTVQIATKELSDLPLHPTAVAPLAWSNTFQSPLDICFDYGLLRLSAIDRYIEVGSGLSTYLAALVKNSGANFTITSIDPSPRADVESQCDLAVRQRMETVVPLLIENSGSGCALFIDGSHRSFPGSDVTRFFIDVLPQLKPGTLVHVHDIYWPWDYPSDLADRYWNEQYLLGAYLLGGGTMTKIVLPGAWAARSLLEAEGINTNASFVQALAANPRSSCWWFKTL